MPATETMRPLRCSSISPARRISCSTALFLQPAQHHPDARRQLAQAEGLGDVIVGAQLQPQHLVVLIQPGGQDDDGCLLLPGWGGLAPVSAHEIVAAHLRHHQVQHDQVGLLMPRHEQRLAPVAGGSHLEALLYQVRLEQRAQLGFIIHHQDFLRHRIFI